MKRSFIIAAVALVVSGAVRAADEPNLASQYTDLPLQSSINVSSPPASAPTAPAAPAIPAQLTPSAPSSPTIPVAPTTSTLLSSTSAPSPIPPPPTPPVSTPSTVATLPAVIAAQPGVAPTAALPSLAPVLAKPSTVVAKTLPQTASTPPKSVPQVAPTPPDLAQVFGRATPSHKGNIQMAYDYAAIAFPEPSYAGGTENAVVNIKASEVLGRMDKQYHGLQSFSADVEMQSSDNKAEPVMDASVLFQRSPERAIANVTGPNSATYIYDGDYIFLYPAPDAQHFMRTENVWNNLAGSGIGTVFGRLVDDPKYDVLSRLVTSGFKSQVDLGDYEDLGMMPPILADGIMCDRVRAKIGTGSVVLLVGRVDHLLRRIMWVENAPDGTNSYFIEQFSNVRMNPPVSETLFKFVPPSGVTMANGN